MSINLLNKVIWLHQYVHSVNILQFLYGQIIRFVWVVHPWLGTYSFGLNFTYAAPEPFNFNCSFKMSFNSHFKCSVSNFNYVPRVSICIRFLWMVNPWAGMLSFGLNFMHAALDPYHNRMSFNSHSTSGVSNCIYVPRLSIFI